MNNEQAYKLIGDRAKELSENSKVKAQCEIMFNNGMSMEEIQGFVTKMAIATLLGI
jgi:hypothetical protein